MASIDHRPALLRKLARTETLSDGDRAMIETMAATNVRTVPARRDLIREGDRPRFAALILSGWGSRHKILVDGRRQTVGFLLPGDMCDVDVQLLDEADHSLGAVTALTVAQLPRELIGEVAANHPRVMRGLRRATMVDASIAREWAVNLGQRSAIERIAHLLCELYLRLDVVGLVNDGTCEMPLTQTDVAEATGMTPVHVNRTIQDLRARGLVRWRGRELQVVDLPGLMRVGLFSAAYLHMGRAGQRSASDLASGGQPTGR